MKRLFLLLLPVALLAYGAFLSIQAPLPPADDAAPERPDESEAANPDVARNDARRSKDGDRAPPGVVPGHRETQVTVGEAAVSVTMSGTVRDDGGRPICGALVRSLHSTDPAVRTDEEGGYEIRVTCWSPVLRVEADGYCPGTRGAIPSTNILDFTLTLGATVTGRVTDAAGRPVPGAQVSELANKDRYVVTGADGTFRYEGARTKHPTALQAHADDHIPGRSGVLAVHPGKELAGVVLVLRRASRIVGRVVPWIGTPSVPTTVTIDGNPELTATTGADGTFRLSPVGGGEAVLRARTADGRVAVCRVDDIPAGGARSGVQVRLGAMLHARVFNAGGEPVAGARVRVRCLGGPGGFPSGDAKTDAEGTVRIGLPFVEEWEVAVRWPKGGSAIAPHRVSASEEPLILHLPALASISGRVTRGGRPASHFTVRLNLDGRGWSHLGEKGRFRIDSLPPGRLTVMVQANDGWSEPCEIDLAPGASVEGLALEIHEAPEIVCRVVDGSGAAVEGATVTLTAGI